MKQLILVFTIILTVAACSDNKGTPISLGGGGGSGGAGGAGAGELSEEAKRNAALAAEAEAARADLAEIQARRDAQEAALAAAEAGNTPATPSDIAAMRAELAAMDADRERLAEEAAAADAAAVEEARAAADAALVEADRLAAERANGLTAAEAAAQEAETLAAQLRAEANAAGQSPADDGSHRAHEELEAHIHHLMQAVLFPVVHCDARYVIDAAQLHVLIPYVGYEVGEMIITCRQGLVQNEFTTVAKLKALEAGVSLGIGHFTEMEEGELHIFGPGLTNKNFLGLMLNFKMVAYDEDRDGEIFGHALPELSDGSPAHGVVGSIGVAANTALWAGVVIRHGMLTVRSEIGARAPIRLGVEAAIWVPDCSGEQGQGGFETNGVEVKSHDDDFDPCANVDNQYEFPGDHDRGR